MENRKNVILSWSGGKDSTIALQRLLKNMNVKIAGLVTTLKESDNMMSMHYVDGALIEKQAASLGIPVYKIYLSDKPDNEEWETKLGDFCYQFSQGITLAYGDLYLEDIRQFRESVHEKLKTPCIFPNWGLNTAELAAEFIETGFKAIVTSVDVGKLDASFAGREYNMKFIQELPADTDPCGENGEFHTFVYDGHIFHTPVPFKKHELRKERSGARPHQTTMAFTSLTID